MPCHCLQTVRCPRRHRLGGRVPPAAAAAAVSAAPLLDLAGLLLARLPGSRGLLCHLLGDQLVCQSIRLQDSLLVSQNKLLLLLR